MEHSYHYPKHIRDLLGIATPITGTPELFLQARWSTERKRTSAWDASYPGTLDSSFGPCQDGTNAHCGASFIPTCADQAPYLTQYSIPCVSDSSFAENLSSVDTDIPWSIKLVRVFNQFLKADGLDGHTGPFLSRETVGLSFYQDTAMNTRFKDPPGAKKAL